MNFEIQIGDEVRIFEEYYHVLNFINERMAYWNNFESHKFMKVLIRKIPSGTETLGISVEEKVNLREHLE